MVNEALSEQKVAGSIPTIGDFHTVGPHEPLKWEGLAWVRHVSLWLFGYLFLPNELRQDPLEAILVIFGQRALIFFVWRLLEKMKNDTAFVRMRSGDHLGDAKMSKKGTSLRRI